VAFVPKGLNDSSLAVYCLGMRKNRTVPLGNGVVGVGRNILRPRAVNVRIDQLIPYPTGRIVSERFPGNKLPGYYHSVPPGQPPQAPVHIFDSTSQTLSRTRTTTSTRTILVDLRHRLLAP